MARVPQTLEEYLQAANAKSREEFIAEFPALVFVVNAASPGTDAYTTARSLPLAPEARAAKLAEIQILRIEKKPSSSNPHSLLVTIGRSPQNDVPVRFPEVSKYHAYVSLGAPGKAKLTDAGSTNGSAINGVGLRATVEAHELKSGDKVTLSGVIDLLYLDPAGLYDFLTTVTPIQTEK